MTLQRSWAAAGFDPGSFWDQCQATYGAAMRGRMDALKQERERVLFGGWATEYFARQDKLKGFSHYAKDMLPREPQTNAGKLAALRNIQASGIPMTIKRIC